MKLPSRSIHEAVGGCSETSGDYREIYRDLQRKIYHPMLLILCTFSSYSESIMLGSKTANLPSKIIIFIHRAGCRNLGSKVTGAVGKAGVPPWPFVPLEWGLASGRPEDT